MTQKEKELFFALCAFCAPDKKRLENYLKNGAATPAVLGMLFANRMAGVAYYVLKRCDLLGKVDREFRNSLKNTALLNERVNRDFFECVKTLTTELDDCKASYALLKGAFLCAWYPKGGRTSNDIDVLVEPSNVGKFSAKLKAAGFKQGFIRNDSFIPATRQQVIESKMTRGETVPFIKEMDLPFMRFLEVDLNFSLDYKNSDDKVLKKMLERTLYRDIGSTQIRTLDLYDFILHLCSHLYKEATTMAWVRMKRDMTFYKYCDIYALLYELTPEQLETLRSRAIANEMSKEFFYCLNCIKSFFPDAVLVQEEDFVPGENLSKVFDPSEKRIYCYSVSDPRKLFFAKDRKLLLREVIT